jgi:hypothetical protein
MRKAFMILAAACALGSGVAAAKPKAIGPTNCPANGGKSKDPFYSVTAVQNMMPPIKTPRPIGVHGDYRLDMRSDRLALVKASSQGINRNILLLNLRRIPDPRAGGHCIAFNGSFPAGRYLQVQITDWRGHSITADIQRPE